MSNKIKLLTAAVTAALGMGFAGQAAATVFASSSLELDDITIVFGSTPAGGLPPPVGGTPVVAVGAGNVNINSFQFSVGNTAQLNNGAVVAGGAVCSGTPGTNNCGVAPTLDSPATSIGILRTNNQTSGDGTFTVFGADSGNWATSDSVIYTSELTNGQPTDTDQIAQANITTATSGRATSDISSTTGLTLRFTVNGPNPTDMTLFFFADPDLTARIINDDGTAYNALSRVSLSVGLNNDNTGDSLSWAPQGTSANNCLTSFGTCYELADAEDLNITVATSTNNTAANHSYGPNAEGSAFYQIYLTGLTAGDWTLQLGSSTTAVVSRVPEPATLALLGAGLAGLGFAGRRQRKQA